MLTTTWFVEPPNTDLSLATWIQTEACGTAVVVVVGGVVVVASGGAVVVGAEVVVVGATVELVTEDGGDVGTSAGAADEGQAEMIRAKTTRSGRAKVRNVFGVGREQHLATLRTGREFSSRRAAFGCDATSWCRSRASVATRMITGQWDVLFQACKGPQVCSAVRCHTKVESSSETR
ncbi:MAG: hypothetical protein IIC71_11740 [Acidobacteria bacterium]|nr:hypothetical protein [Acidobacteriota bacterium]